MRHISAVYAPEEYPALRFQLEEWSESRPFSGLSMVDATPPFTNTLVKYLPLLAGGARLAVGIGDLTPFDPEVVDNLRSWGVPVVSPGNCVQADVVLDCAGVFSETPGRFGCVELTRSGVYRYRDRSAAVFFADAGRIKFIETSLGTGDGCLRALRSLGYELGGKRFLIFGGGKVGRGIAFYALREGASVSIVDPAKTDAPSGATPINGNDDRAVRMAMREADFIVSATGIAGALSGYAEALSASPAVIANMGVEDEFGSAVPAKRILNGKRPLNFILPEPTRLRYIDPTMALDNAGALELVLGRVDKGIHEPPPELEARILDIVRRSGIINEELDMLEENF